MIMKELVMAKMPQTKTGPATMSGLLAMLQKESGRRKLHKLLNEIWPGKEVAHAFLSLNGWRYAGKYDSYEYWCSDTHPGLGDFSSEVAYYIETNKLLEDFKWQI